MSEKLQTYDPNVATAVLDGLQELMRDLPEEMPVAFEELTVDPGDMPRLMLKPLASDAEERRYISGEQLRAFPFSVTLRLEAESEQKRLDAYAYLAQLAKAWAATPIEAPGYAIFRQRQLTIPTCLGRTERFEDWQVTMELKYKQIL